MEALNVKKKGRRMLLMNSKTFNDGYQKNDLPLFHKGTESQDFIPEQHVRKTDPATSRMASDQAGGLSHRHCAEIKKTLDDVFPKGLNFEEIANLAGFTQTTQVSRRMVDLERQGMAERTGETSMTSSGRHAQTWRGMA